MRADPPAGAEACDAQPSLRAFHQRRGHGSQLNPKIQTEVCHHPPLQAHGGAKNCLVEFITALKNRPKNVVQNEHKDSALKMTLKPSV